LLSYAGWGHAAFLVAGNFCIDSTVTRYFLSTRVPAAGAVCQPEGSPFGPLAASAQARAKAAATVGGALLQEAARRALTAAE